MLAAGGLLSAAGAQENRYAKPLTGRPVAHIILIHHQPHASPNAWLRLTIITDTTSIKTA
jgi:hypothetical protein